MTTPDDLGDGPGLRDDATRLAEAIHKGRITVNKHGPFTEKCICNSVARDIIRGLAGLVPQPTVESVIREYGASREEAPEPRLRAALDTDPRRSGEAMTAVPPTPLSPEEVASVRRLHPDGECDHDYSGCREAQWVATLDAALARAASAVEALPTIEYARSPLDWTYADGLDREAVLRILRAPDVR